MKILVECLSVDDNAVKSFNILASLSVRHNYFDSPNQIYRYLYLIFKFFTKIVLFVY